MTQINGRVAVVTGGASGIGRGIAEQLIEEGASVVIADIDATSLAQTADEIGALPVQTDVTDPVSVQSLAAATLEAFGRVDIVVNNAGVGPAGLIEDLTLDDWRWIIDVNLFGVIHGVHVFLPLLIANAEGGHIVNTASMAIFSPLPNLGPYTASKRGVQGLSETLALEMAEHHPNIKVSILPPGPVRTNIKESLKHRPATSVGTLTDVDLGESEESKQLRWIEPRTAGRVVTQAIRGNDLYAITHPDWWPMVSDQFELIHREFDRYEPLT